MPDFSIASNIPSIPAASLTSTPSYIVTKAPLPDSEMTLFIFSEASTSGSLRLPSMITFAPFLANFVAIARPIPVPLPVMRAVLFLNFSILNLKFGSLFMFKF